MTYQRILLKPKEGYDIQGTYLRRKIKEFFGDDVNGQVRNIKSDGSVEVIIQCKGGEANQFYEDMKKELRHPLFKIDFTKSEVQENLFEFNDFKIIREDDLCEMSWALQGSGQVFAEMTKDKYRRRIIGLIREVNEIAEKIGQDKKLRLFCLKEFSIEPSVSITDQSLINLICGFYDDCLLFNEELKLNKKSKKIGDIKERIGGSIQPVVDAFGKELKKLS